MKKTILTIVLSIYLTITTVASVVFGYLYFSNLSKNGFTISDAQALAARVWSDLSDFNDSAVQASEYQSSSSTVEYEEYNKNSISFGDFTDQSDEFYGTWGKIYISFALLNSLLSTHNSKNQLQQNTLYNSTLNFHYTGSGFSDPTKNKFKNDLFAAFHLTKNSAVASVWDIQTDSSTEGAGIGYVIELIKGEGLGWEMNTATYKKEFNDQISNLTKFYQVNTDYYTAAADSNGKIYKMHYSSMTLEDGSKEKKENIVSNDVNSFELKEANVETHKKLNKSKENLSTVDLEEQANNHLKSINALNDKALSFKNLEAVESDFSNKFFEDFYGKGDFEKDN